jgi:hypothetical protein
MKWGTSFEEVKGAIEREGVNWKGLPSAFSFALRTLIQTNVKDNLLTFKTPSFHTH